MTELVSRVLYTFSQRKRQPSSIFTANYFAVQAQTGSATMKGASSPVAKGLRIKVLHRIGFTADLRYRKNW